LKLKVGIFDSGIGGFTVLNSLLQKRRDVQVIYLADTARNPYGNRESYEIKQIAIEISKWFKKMNVDVLLVACNTTNACALDILNNNSQIPCFDLINSVSEIVSENEVGILATTATIKSDFYKKILQIKRKNIKVFQQGCPAFVSEIEKVPLNIQKIKFLTELYLRPLLDRDIKEIILGCSHYPLISHIIREKISKDIKIIDPSYALVSQLNKSFPISYFEHKNETFFSDVEFFATGCTNEFSIKVTNWLEINKKIRLVNLRTDT
tara:strand:- start:5534 stop:6328 length:795 start_codon:yes stop_codon:yes gene_type:complete